MAVDRLEDAMVEWQSHSHPTSIHQDHKGRVACDFLDLEDARDEETKDEVVPFSSISFQPFFGHHLAQANASQLRNRSKPKGLAASAV